MPHYRLLRCLSNADFKRRSRDDCGGELCSHTLASLLGLDLAQAVEEHAELLSAQSGDGVSGPHVRLENGCECPEHIVAGRVAEAVVDSLEKIKIEQREIASPMAMQ